MDLVSAWPGMRGTGDKVEGFEVGTPEFGGVLGDAVVSGATGLVPEMIEVCASYSVIEVELGWWFGGGG